MDKKYESFSRQLSEIPPVPDTVYPAVIQKINRRKQISGIVWAIAASVILAVSIVSYNIRPTHKTVATEDISQDVIDELQAVRDFLNGNSLEEDLRIFALMDPELFNNF